MKLRGGILVLSIALTLSGKAAQDYASVPGPEQPVGPVDRITPSAAEGLRLNFAGVPLGEILDYLNKATGLIFVSQAQPKGNVDLRSDSPVNKYEAVELLNAALQQNGSGAVLNGRIVTILNADESKRNRKVILGSDPEKIPITEKQITQILPVHFVEATKLVKDLAPLASAEATIIANESANCIVITDRQNNIHKLAQIIRAIDASAEDPKSLRVFALRNSNPDEIVDVLTELFPDQNSTQNGSSPFAGDGGPPGFPGGGPMGPPGEAPGNNGSDVSGANAQGDRRRNRDRVIAVADGRTASVAVVAAGSVMGQIERIITELDSNPKGRQTVSVLQANNASPQALKQVLQDIFSKNTSSNNRNVSTATDALEKRRTTQTQQGQQNGTASRTGTSSGTTGAAAGPPQ